MNHQEFRNCEETISAQEILVLGSYFPPKSGFLLLRGINKQCYYQEMAGSTSMQTAHRLFFLHSGTAYRKRDRLEAIPENSKQ